MKAIISLITTFFSSYKQYLMIGGIAVVLSTTAFFYIKSENEKYQLAQQQLQQITQDNQNLSKQINALQTANQEAASATAEVENESTKTSNSIKSSTYNNDSATTEVNSLFGEMK